jgi:DNA-binding transcriptional LysR family regulator
MDLTRLDLNLLVSFEALWAERSVSRAARRMGIGQPAMSDALRRLRGLFGDALFVRASGGMQPTPKARALAGQIAPLLGRLREVMGEQVAFAAAEARRAFTLASTDYTTLVLLPELLGALRRQAPGIDLRLVGYDKDAVAGLLDRGEVDLAVGVFPSPPPGSVATPLFTEHFVGLARIGHPALRAEPIDLATFAGLPQALVSVRRDERGIVDEALKAHGLTRRVALVVPYMLLLAKTLAETDLVAVVPERAAVAIDGRALRRFTLPVALEPFTVAMLWNPVARSDAASGWLRQLVVACARTPSDQAATSG